MTFVCPYCQAQTKTNIASVSSCHGFGKAKCSTCGRHFLFMPMSVRMEDESAWKHFRSEAFTDYELVLIVVLIVSVIVGIIIAAILGSAIIP